MACLLWDLHIDNILLKQSLKVATVAMCTRKDADDADKDEMTTWSTELSLVL